MEKDILKTFGHNIQTLRKARGLTQEQLAEKSGLHRTYIGMIERAEKNITLRNIEKLSKALDVNLDILFKSL